MPSFICFEVIEKNFPDKKFQLVRKNPYYQSYQRGQLPCTGEIPFKNSILFYRNNCYEGLMTSDGKTLLFPEDYKQQKLFLDEIRRSGKKYTYSDYFRIDDDHFIDILNVLSEESDIILSYVDFIGDPESEYKRKPNMQTITVKITKKTVFSYYKGYLISRKKKYERSK